MKLTLRKGLIALLGVCFALCLAIGLSAASCNTSSGSTEHEHTYSEVWSTDNTAHWHACTYEGCEEVSDYEEHVPSDAGSATSSAIWYTCEVCGANYYVSLTDDTSAYTYVLYVYNIGNAGVAGVTVNLYSESGSLLTTSISGTNGITRFRNLTAGNYTAVVDSSTIPEGYSYDEADLTVEFTSSVRTATITLTPHLITSTMPSGTSYSLGDVMYNFEATAYFKDGTSKTMTLADYLEEYDAVVINFFYTSCSYCLLEFPYMNQAYNTTLSSTTNGYYYEDIALIEVDYIGQDTSLSTLVNWLSNSSYAYDNVTYIYDTIGLTSAFGVSGWPTTVVVDKYGVITVLESGYQPTVSYWSTLFETYLEDNYVPTYSTSSNTGSSDSDVTVDKPTEEMPESGEIANAIVKENGYTSISGTSESDTGTFEFSAYSVDGVVDEYSYPWLISDGTAVEGVTDYIYTSNSNKLGTYSILVIDVKLEAGQAFMFDYYTSTESGGDYFYIQVDTVLQAQLSGISGSWQTFCYVAQYSGYYQITLTYQKNTSVDEVDDKVYVANMYIDLASTAVTETTVLANADLLYNAATPYTLDGTQDSYYAGQGYKNYVSVYIGSDGYYRVNLYNDETKDPYLLADLYYTTPWNSEYSVWNYASAYLDSEDDGEENNYGILYGNSEYNQALEDYSWVQTNCPWGYVPVDSYLAEILKAVTKSYGTTTQEDNEYQWLEVCRYYIHYGAESSTHECKSTTNLAAGYGVRMAEYVGTIGSSNTADNEFSFYADVETAVLPRGFYYSFTVETSGVYTFYSKEAYIDADGYDPDGNEGVNTYAWITDATGHLISDASNDDYDLNEYEIEDTIYYNNNFYIYVYLKAGETYMLGAAFAFSEDTGAYNVYGYYLGETYTYLTAAVSDGLYTYEYVNDTYNYYVPANFFTYTEDEDGNRLIDEYNYYLDDDGYYYVYNVDGTVSPLYINMTGITHLNDYSSYTLKQAIEGYLVYDEETDTTTLEKAWSGTTETTMKTYLALAESNQETAADGSSLKGYVQADETIVAILNAYINGEDSSSSTYAGTAWLFTAYYVKTINEASYSVASSRVIDD